jgi:two-component system response regulator HydG
MLNQRKFIGQSLEFREIVEMVNLIAPRDCTVMLMGESGTGKEMVAQRLHSLSLRASGPFIPVDCINLSGELFSSQLFGHVKGAFTGADQETLGFCRAANGGTIFFDEIGDLPQGVQGKLLRVLQESKITPVGGTVEYPVDIRVICATNRNLGQMVRDGKFRQDLYYRLKIIEIVIPPLRKRQEDILPLAEYFLKNQMLRYKTTVTSFSREVVQAFLSYDWPGNVRELANVIERACLLSHSRSLQLLDLPVDFRMKKKLESVADHVEIVPLEVAEKNLVISTLRATGGNQARAAKLLEIDRRRLYRMIRKYYLQEWT